jgi:hypothetical protein
VRWDEQTLALVIEAALLAAVDAGYGLASVEERRGLRTLLLLELDDELESGPKTVHRKLRAERSRKGRIAAEPVERRLAAARTPASWTGCGVHMVTASRPLESISSTSP